MPNIGIRRLKNEASAIIRAVREERTEYIITYRGEPVAVIAPLDKNVGDLGDGIMTKAELQARLDALGVEIDAAWQSEKSAVELLSEQRR